MFGIARSLGMTSNTVADAVEQVGRELGDKTVYKFSQTPAVAYSPQQQEIIIEQLRVTGKIHESAPDGYLSGRQLYEQWGVSKVSVDNAVKKLRDDLGVVGRHRGEKDRGSKPYFSPDQQQQIYGELQRVGSLVHRAPEGYQTINGIGVSLGVKHPKIARAVDRIQAELGDTVEYRFGSHVYPSYSPEQQQLIHAQLQREGSLAPRAPESYQTIGSLKASLGMAHSKITRVANLIRDELGDPTEYRMGDRTHSYYSPEKVEILHRHLGRL